MKFIEVLSLILGIVVAVAYLYQIIYFIVGMFAEARYRLVTSKRPPLPGPAGAGTSRYGFIIAARNEANVIGQLVDSLKKQDYPEELFDIFVIADNCDDNTAEVARRAGAIVYERNNTEKKGKGFAVNTLFEHIKEDYGSYGAYDAYIVFDADNIVEKNFLTEMDKEFSKGECRVITSYRNSKNFGANWITSGYSVAFMREAQYLNRPRRILRSSATVSGTGYLFSHTLLEENGGWPYHLLTEDLELSADLIVKGEKIGYAGSAMFYDEQPTKFKQSWTQRVRWTRGFYQVIYHYGKDLIKNMFKDRSMALSRYDIFMFLAPSLMFNLATVALSVLALVLNIVDMNGASKLAPDVGLSFLSGLIGYYALNFVQGFITVISEWKKIRTTSGRKIASMFTYPLYMFTYIPISLVALLVRPQWTPIAHSVTTSIEDMNRENVQTVRELSHENVPPHEEAVYSEEPAE